MKPAAVLVSACLLGVRSRYDGSSCETTEATAAAGAAVMIPVCPEQLGGLPTPRPRSEITGAAGANGRDVLAGRTCVFDEFGADATRSFLKGAEEVLKIGRLVGAAKAILKERSPSCGVSVITRDGESADGPGVTAALLEDNGIETVGIK